MKKIIISVSCLIASSLAFAGGGSIKKVSANDEGPLSNGFFFNLGTAFTKSQIMEYGADLTDVSNITKQQSYNIAPTLELGNQWYFYNTDAIGAGLRVSWLQLGYASYNNVDFTGAKGYLLNAQLLKITPQFTFAFADKIAVDASFGFAPTAFFVNDTEPVKRSNGKDQVSTINYGLNYVPGIRLRYSKFNVGFDYSFGTLTGTGTLPSGISDNEKITKKMSSTRIYLGFQF